MANEGLKEKVRSYAADVEAAAAGTLYKVDGEPTAIDDMDEWKRSELERLKDGFLKEHPFTDPEDKETYESEDEYVADNIGDVDDIYEPEQMSMTDYLNDNSLGDIRFEVDRNMECCGGKVLLAYGGPNVWLHDDEICGYLGGDTETWPLSSAARDALMEFFQEEWGMVCGSH